MRANKAKLLNHDKERKRYMNKRDLKKRILVMFLAIFMGITYTPSFAIEDDVMGAAQEEMPASLEAEHDYEDTESEDETIPDTPEPEESVQSVQDGITPEMPTTDETEEQSKDAESIPVIEESTTEDIAFNATKSDCLSYDPLYIAEYADTSLVDVSGVDMSRFVNVVSAAKGVATYNVKKQSDFKFSETNYIAGMNYEMPVYNVDDKSDYYVTIPNVNLFNSNFKAYDLILAYNNDYGEIISGWKYRKGILYIPKAAIDSPKNSHPVPESACIAVQLNYAIGGDMDFSKSIPSQILRDKKPVNKTVHTSNIFDVDNLIVDTGVKGRRSDDISVYLNGHLIPINEGAWEYSKTNGELRIQALPGVVSNINVVFENRTILKKAADVAISFVENTTPATFAATSMDDMLFFKTEKGKEVTLDIPSDKLFVGWRGYYDANWEHSARGGINDSQLNALKGFKNSVDYLYGGYTNQGGATGTDEQLDVRLAPLWAISSYAAGSDLGLQDSSGQLTKNEIVRHQVSMNPDVYEEHTIYEWLLKYRNKLEKSAKVTGSGNTSYPESLRNGIGGFNNFAFQFPRSVSGATGSLVSSGEDAGRENLSFRIESDEIDDSYYLAASCNHLGETAASNGNKRSRIYVTCIGLGTDYVVLSFVKVRDGQNAAAIYKFRSYNSAYLKLKKTAATSETNYLKAAPGNYSLKGAEYQLYTNSGCTTPAKTSDGSNAKLVTDANGDSPALEMEPGTYYIKEVKASPGYLIEKEQDSPKVTKIVLTTDNTESNPYVFKSIEKPSYIDPKIIIKKYDSTGTKGWDRLINAEYRISYYAMKVPYGDENGDQDPATVKYPAEPTRSWTFRTHKIEMQNDPSDVFAGIDWQNDQPVSGDEFYIENGKRILPLGYYTIRETKAPVGLALNETVHYGKIYQKSNGLGASNFYDGKDMNKTADVLFKIYADEQPQKIRLAVKKVDAETGCSAAQGAGREFSKGSLAGAEYEVYYDNDETDEPELVGSMITNEEGEAILNERISGRAEALGRSLEAGTYYIKEIKASPGYVTDKFYLNGNETKEIKNGKIEVSCGYDLNGKPMTKTVKGSYEDGKHLFKARVQNKDASVFTYTVASEETPHHAVIHKTDITTGDEIPGAKLRVINSDGETVDEWISTNKPHDIIALPEGKYTLSEITAPYGYDIAEDIEFAVDNNVIVSEVVMKNKPLMIGTTAHDAEADSHHGTFNEEETITDVVELSGLYEGRSYKIAGKIIDKASGLALLDKDGNEITAESEVFVAKGDAGKVDLSFVIDSSEFTQDSSVVVFERLYRTSSVRGEEVPIEIAKHEDISDESQSIRYGGIIGTIASDKKGGDHNIPAKKKAIVIDTVEYSNLSPEETYFISGSLYDKTTGELTDISGSTEFVPESESGSVQVKFKFDATELEGHSLVAFEYAFTDEKMISKHDDPDNKGQTVYITASRKIPKTGDPNYLMLYAIITAIAMSALALMIYARSV